MLLLATLWYIGSRLKVILLLQANSHHYDCGGVARSGEPGPQTIKWTRVSLVPRGTLQTGIQFLRQLSNPTLEQTATTLIILFLICVQRPDQPK